MFDGGAPSSSSGAAAAPTGCLTLRDYLTHQRTLQQLQRLQDVWLVDDLLGLSYRARLQLCLAPHPHLRMTDTADGSAATLLIPLVAACRIDAAGAGADAGLRLTTPSECAVRSLHLVPAEPPASEVSAVAAAWATVLHRLCRPATPALMAAAHTSAPTTPLPCPVAAVPSVSTPAPTHVDPAGGAATAGAVPAALSELGRRPSRAQSSPLRALLPYDAEDIGWALDDLTCGISSRSRTSAELLRRRQLQSQPHPVRPASASPAVTRAAHAGAAESGAAEVPRREPPERRSSSGVDAALSLDGMSEPERPPTMAHAGLGLVPELSRHAPLRTTSSFAVAADEEDEEEGEVANADGAQGISGGGVEGSHVDADLADSDRPQAPRGGHVGDLGSLGPPRDDAEALRMYNEIHGIHSSTSSSRSGSEPSSSAPYVSPRHETGDWSATPPPLGHQRRGPNA